MAQNGASPPPLRGRRNERVQTDKYLEELVVNPYEIDVGCQTDLYLERPPTPPFVSFKTGVDMGVQVQEGDLIDMEKELKNLVDECITQAVIEVSGVGSNGSFNDDQNDGNSDQPRKEKRESAAHILQVEIPYPYFLNW